MANVTGKAAAAAAAAAAVSRALSGAAEAERAFEQRWTMAALMVADRDLHEAVCDQRWLLRAAEAAGDPADIIMHSEAMCRGWRAAAAAMKKAGVAGDAVMIGEFGEIVVAIGRSQTAPPYLIERYGERLAYLRPREVAAMYMHYRQAQSVKAIWPDAEIVEVREKADG
jgi:hypothetical protein